MADDKQPQAPVDATSKGLKGRQAQSMNAIAEELNKQPKVKINVPRPQHIKKGLHHKVVVTINGYSLSIPTGVFCIVPREAYLILVRAGLIQPQTEEDQCEVPAIITMSGPEYDLMNQGGAGSISNPVVVL